jgi:uncharacterized iron-regulated protein
MLRLSLLLAGLTTLLLSPSYAVCPYPEEVRIPDGTTATTEEMVSAQTLVKEYMARMESYLDCLDHDEATIPENQTPEAKALHVQRHNTAVDAMENIATKFNEQIRVYKTVNN